MVFISFRMVEKKFKNFQNYSKDLRKVPTKIFFSAYGPVLVTVVSAIVFSIADIIVLNAVLVVAGEIPPRAMLCTQGYKKKIDNDFN